MGRLVRCKALGIALAAGFATSGCETMMGGGASPSPQEDAAAALGAAEDRFAGRWYALDSNLSCQPDKVVTFADGSAVLEGRYSMAVVAEATDDANAQAAGEVPPLTLPYRVETDEKSGLTALVVDRGETKDKYWQAGPDYLLALNAEGYDVLAHCD